MLKIKQFIPEGYCLKCRGCCRFSQKQSIWAPRLLEEEKKKIGGISALEYEPERTFVCSYLNVCDNNCRIYSSRPFECQLYPFLLNRRGNKKFLAVDLNCPFVKENRDKEAFKAFGMQMADLIKSPALLVVLRKNLQMFQPYADVLELSEINL